MTAREFLMDFLNNSFVGDNDPDFSDEFMIDLIVDDMTLLDFFEVMEEYANYKIAQEVVV